MRVKGKGLRVDVGARRAGPGGGWRLLAVVAEVRHLLEGIRFRF